MIYLFLIFLGLLVGLISSILGLGGNILIIPLLPYIVELPLKSVIATGIFTVFFITLINSLSFYKQKLIDFKLILKLIIPTFSFSFFASWSAQFIPDHFIKFTFICLMVLMLIRLNTTFFKFQKQGEVSVLLLISVGSLSGFLAGLTGIGNGLVLVPILLGFNLIDHRKISPTVNFIIMISCLAASLNNLSFEKFNFPSSGLVRIDFAFIILFGAILSAFFGRKINSKISPSLRSKLVSLVLSLLIIQILFSS